MEMDKLLISEGVGVKCSIENSNFTNGRWRFQPEPSPLYLAVGTAQQKNYYFWAISRVLFWVLLTESTSLSTLLSTFLSTLLKEYFFEYIFEHFFEHFFEYSRTRVLFWALFWVLFWALSWKSTFLSTFLSTQKSTLGSARPTSLMALVHLSVHSVSMIWVDTLIRHWREVKQVFRM